MNKKFIILPVVALMGTLVLTSCSSDDDKNETKETEFSIVRTTPIVDQASYALNTTEANYSSKSFGTISW